METSVYVLDTRPLENPEAFAKWYKKVPEYRQKKIDAYSDMKDKALCLGTGLVLSHAIAAAGFDEIELKIAYEESGKPYFKNDPDFHFSLSHSHERAMCAVSDEPIGCDVQVITKDADFDPTEWARLESYAKATDEPLSALMGRPLPENHVYTFTDIDFHDEYKYLVCANEAIPDTHIFWCSLDWKAVSEDEEAHA